MLTFGFVNHVYTMGVLNKSAGGEACSYQRKLVRAGQDLGTVLPNNEMFPSALLQDQPSGHPTGGNVPCPVCDVASQLPKTRFTRVASKSAMARSALIVAAIERSGANAFRIAGACLALAAAIKLYPAFIALLWLGEKKYSATIWFVSVGGLPGSPANPGGSMRHLRLVMSMISRKLLPNSL